MSGDINVQSFSGKVNINNNLLVGSSHLFVDTVNNRVGITTASPDAGLHVNSNAYVHTDFRVGSGIVMNDTNGRITAGSFVGDGSAMTGINSDSGSWVNGTNSNVHLATSTDKVGIGTTDPEAQLHIGPKDNDHIYLASANNNYGWKIDTDDQGNGAVPFRIIKRTDDVDTTVLTIKNQDGNVGIGTTSPVQKLDVRSGNIRLHEANSYATDRYIYTKWEDGNNDHQIGLEFDYYTGSGGTGAEHSRINFVSNATRNVEINGSGKQTMMSVLSSGNVGIGTTNPGEKLTVNGNLDFTPVYGNQGDSNKSGMIIFNKPIGESIDTSTNIDAIYYDDATNRYHFTQDTTKYASGNAGIVCGEVKLNTVHFNETAGSIAKIVGSTEIDLYSDNKVRFIESDASAERVTFDLNNGFLGINNTAPDKHLVIGTGAPTSAQFSVDTSTASHMIVGNEFGSSHYLDLVSMGSININLDSNDNDTDKVIDFRKNTRTNGGSLLMRIKENGNVGIGTTSPGYKLDVNGDINSSGKINIGNYAVGQGYMSSRTLTLGSTSSNYGGGNNWNTNTAAILLECADNTEIAVHDGGTRVASLMHYEGSPNRITIGRNMGWGTIASVRMYGSQSYPNRPVAMVGKTNGRVYTPNVIVYNSVLYNDGGMYNTSNGRFTAPAGYAGYYLVTYTGLGGANETAPNTRWQRNGNDLAWGSAHINNNPCSSRWGLSTQFIYYLNAGDYLTHRLIGGSIYGSSTTHSTTVVMFMGSR